jgi:HSP20 family molecular chaperone IbpA
VIPPHLVRKINILKTTKNRKTFGKRRRFCCNADLGTADPLAQRTAPPHILTRRVAKMGPAAWTVAFDKDVSMTKLMLGSHPYLLGFDQLERLLERNAKSGNEGYPPFNIEQTSNNSYRITLAVAGFAENDLAITVEDRQLVIRGRQRDDTEGRVYLHRGIAARQFQRSFVLADGVEVGEAIMENGLLHVDLTRAQPETVVQTIRIRKG